MSTIARQPIRDQKADYAGVPFPGVIGREFLGEHACAAIWGGILSVRHNYAGWRNGLYNLEDPSTNYQNSVDFHLDRAATQFLSKQFLVGVVGYLYQEVGCDSGSGDHVGCFQSRVVGLGPQVGYSFPSGTCRDIST